MHGLQIPNVEMQVAGCCRDGSVPQAPPKEFERTALANVVGPESVAEFVRADSEEPIDLPRSEGSDQLLFSFEEGDLERLWEVPFCVEPPHIGFQAPQIRVTGSRAHTIREELLQGTCYHRQAFHHARTFRLAETRAR